MEMAKLVFPSRPTQVFIPLCAEWVGTFLSPLIFYYKHRERHRVHLVEELEKFSELASLSQSQAWKPGCAPFHPLSGPGALRAECKTLPPNCCLENLIVSVVSWKNKEHRAVLFCLHYVFLCPVFKIIAYESVREHVRVYRIWWCPCSCNLNLLYTELSVLMCFIICLDGYYVNARGAM